jgi:hypothetical protein
MTKNCRILFSIFPSRNRFYFLAAGPIIAVLAISTAGHTIIAPASAQENIRKDRFTAPGIAEAAAWQRQCREKLFELMMGGGKPETIPLSPQILRRENMSAGGYWLQEMTLASSGVPECSLSLSSLNNIPMLIEICRREQRQSSYGNLWRRPNC